MAVPLVQVRHKTTGRKTFLPETALRLPDFRDYVKTPSQKARDEVPDGTAFPAETSGDEPATVDAKSADTTTKAPSASDKRS